MGLEGGGGGWHLFEAGRLILTLFAIGVGASSIKHTSS